MKPIKIIMALIAALILLPSCGEEEWENLTYEQKYIETLLHQQKPKHDIGYELELVDTMRYVILKIGNPIILKGIDERLDDDPNPMQPYIDTFGSEKIYRETYCMPPQQPTDTIGVVTSVTNLRRGLKLTEDDHLTYKGYDVVGIEDVTVDKGPIRHSVELSLYSIKDIPEVEEYISSLGCSVARLIVIEELDYAYMSILLPLEKKAIPTRDEILASKHKLEGVEIRPWGTYWQLD